MLSKLFWKISATMFIGFVILLKGCAKDDPSSEEVNAVIAERLDLIEDQAARVQPVTAEIWVERQTLLVFRINIYDQILVQLKNESVDPIEKHCHYLIQHRNSAYFPDKFMPESTSGTWNENLSFSNSNSINHMNYHTGALIKTFDPLYGSYKENTITKKLRIAKQYKSGYL